MPSVRRKSNLKKSNPNNLLFEELIKKATKAANEAGDIWVASHIKPIWSVVDDYTGNQVGTLLDVCGFGYVEVKDKRTSFAKWLKTVQNNYNNVVHVKHKYYYRQEMSLNEATAYAVWKVLTDAGIKGLSVYSRID